MKKEDNFDIIIIGAGAAGLVAAIEAMRGAVKKRVLVLEKNPIPGKKLSRTGNGRCNFTNRNISAKHYNSSDKESLDLILSSFTFEDSLSFFSKEGIVPYERNGCFYPYSGEAKSFRDLLFLCAEEAGAIFTFKDSAVSLKKEGDLFRINTENDHFFANKVILSTGGLAAPDTGATGEGYDILSSLGLDLKKPLPSLSPLKCEGAFPEDFAGIRVYGRINIAHKGRIVASDFGELQFNKGSISGIPVLNVSSPAIRLFDEGERVKISLDLLPKDFEPSILLQDLRSDIRVKDALLSILNYKMIPFFLKKAGISLHDSLSDMSPKKLKALFDILSSFTFDMTGYAGFEKAQTSSGGLSLSEVNPHTMELLKFPGLFVTGELLDCDGICGGYNLHFAFATGRLAGKALAGGK